MPRGHEDWFITKTAFGKALSDVGELGARLGIPYSFTRSGKVIYSDGFEASAAPWEYAESEGGGVGERDSTYSFRGAYSYKLQAPAGVEAYAVIQKPIPYVRSGKAGIDALLWTSTNCESVYIELYFRTGGYVSRYRIRVRTELGDININTPGPSWTEVLSGLGDLTGGNRFFYYFKLVIDPENEKYNYLLMNNNRVDLSSYSPYKFVQAGPEYILVILRSVSYDGTPGPVYIDDVTLTIDEP